jgi:hypothetical protein
MSERYLTRRTYRRIALLSLMAPLLVVLVALATRSTATAATCKQWTGAVSTSWTAAGNWSPSGAPAATDCVVIDDSVSVPNEPTISTGTTVAIKALTLDQHTLTINGTGSLTLSGPDGSSMPSGKVTGSGTLNIGGPMAWSSGTMDGSGQTVVLSGGTLSIAPTSINYAVLDTRTLTNNVGGTIAYSTIASGFSLYFGGESCSTTSLVNNGSFTYAGPSGNDPGIDACGPTTITNGAAGTLTKTSGSAVSPMDPAIDNAGTVTSKAGVLQFNGGSSSGTGSFVGTSPGTISFAAGTFALGNGASLSGVSVDGGTLQAGPTGSPSSANVTFSGSNAMTSGRLDGNGVFTVTGTMAWTSGSMVSSGTGTGTTVIAAGGTMNMAPTNLNYAILDTRTLTNNGAINYTTISSGFSLYLGGETCNSTTLVNNGSMTLSGPNSNDPGINTCGSNAIVNGATGTIVKNAGTAVSSIQPGLRNGGSVSATAGTLQLNGDPTSAVGTFGGTSPGKVSLTGGTFVLGDGSTFTGTATIDGATVVAGTTGSPSSAKVTFSGSNAFASGRLDGNGIFSVTGTLTWTSGSMDSSGTGTGTTVIAAGGTVNIAPTNLNYAILDTRTLTNNGAIAYTTISGGFSLYLGGDTCNSTTLVNNGSMTLAGPNSNDPGINTCGSNAIVNSASGTFTKNSGTAVASIPTSFDNTGTIAVSSGTLQFNGAFPAYNGSNKLLKGTYNLTNPGVLQFPNAAITINAATITLNGGSGALIQDTAGSNALADFATNTGSLTVLSRTQTVKPFTNSGTVTVGPGASASTLASTGAYTQSAGSTVLANAASTLQTGGSGNVSINGGTLSGVGTVKTPTATTSLSNASTVSPGNPVSGTGTLTVVGKYTQSSAGTLNVNVAGTPGSGSFDQVTANRAITLGGTLNIDSTGYTHTLDDVFTIVSTSSGGITGTFSTVTGTELGGSYYYDVIYNANSVQLVVRARDADVSVTTTSPANVVADPTQPANDITWTLTVNNAGPAVATNVSVVDTIPATVQLVSVTPSQGTCGALSGTTVTCSVGSILPNPGTPPSIVVVAKPLDPGTLTNQAVVSATQNDPASGNNTASDSVTAAAQAGVTYVDVKNNGFSVASEKVGLGKTIQYTFLGTLTHHLTDPSALIDSGSAAPRTFFRLQLQAAGKYVVSDTALAGTNTITVLPTVKNKHDGTYKITWSLYGTTPAGYGYDVTVTGPLGTVTNVTPTRTEKSTTYTPTDGPGKYKVKARIRDKPAGLATGFATKKFTV